MVIQLKKGRDGPPNLTCVRTDGTRTWGKVHPFFPVHDLTHCAVETVLGLDQAFFGLIAAGWSIDDFGVREIRERMGPEALWAECIVGLFDRERGAGDTSTAQEFNETLAASLHGLRVPPFRPLTDGELTRVRELRDMLAWRDRKSVVWGKSVDLGGRRI